MSKANQENDHTVFLLTMTEEVQSMSAQDLLNSQELAKLEDEFSTMFAASKKEAGRRRLAAAKNAISNDASGQTSKSKVSIEDARRFLAEAANDKRFTMAARNLSEMPDDETMRLYLQLQELLNISQSNTDGDI